MNRSRVLLSVQRALLGSITENMKAITIGYNETTFKLRVYFKSKPDEEETEILQEITSEVSADFPELINFEEEAISLDSDSEEELKKLDEWVFRTRKLV